MSAHPDRGEDSRGSTRFVRALRDRWWLILIMMILFGALGFGLSSIQEPRYAATAQVAYAQQQADAVSKALTDAGTAGLSKTLASDALIVQTSAFAQQVSEALGGAVSPETVQASLTTSVSPGVDVIDIEATASESALAADLANASADEFIATRQEEIDALLQSALDFIEGRAASLTPAQQSSSEAAELDQQAYALQTLLDGSVADYTVLERASAPADPYSPRPLVNIAIGVALGLVIGLLLVWLTSSMSRRINDQATLAHALDLPVVGALPVPPSKQGGKRSGVGFKKGSEHLLEPTKMLRSNLKVLGFGESKRTLLITSTASAEGKSSLAVNLALSMALAGDRVILVDADLRNPSIHTYLGIPNDRGLGDALAAGSADWSDKVQAVDLAPFVDQQLLDSRKEVERDSGVTKFLCLTSGTSPADPGDALGSGAFSGLLAELQGYSDYVIVDGPPMVATSDSLILARSVDAVILTSTLGKQTASEARQVRQLLARADIEALGLVLFGTRLQMPDLRQG